MKSGEDERMKNNDKYSRNIRKWKNIELNRVSAEDEQDTTIKVGIANYRFYEDILIKEERSERGPRKCMHSKII